MRTKIGLLILYLLLIGSALTTSFREPRQNPFTLAAIWFCVLTFLLVSIVRARHQHPSQDQGKIKEK